MPYPSPHETRMQKQFKAALIMACMVLAVLLALMALTL